MTAVCEKPCLQNLVCHTIPLQKLPVELILMELAFKHDVWMTKEQLIAYLNEPDG